MAKKKTEYGRFLALSDSAKDAELAKYDRPLPVGPDGLPGRPLTAADRRCITRAKVGRPRIGKGAKIVPVSIERGLLKQADAFARAHKLNRSQMVVQGLRMLMQRVKAG